MPNVTVIPLTGLSSTSFTSTTNGARVDRMLPLWPFPEISRSFAAEPAVAVAVKETGVIPGAPVTLALTTYWPTFVPSDNVVEACPLARVLEVRGERTCPVVPTGFVSNENVTPTLSTGFPLASVTRITNGESVEWVTADWPEPETMAIVAGGPAVTEKGALVPGVRETVDAVRTTPDSALV